MNEVKITYVNRSTDKVAPQIALFMQNTIPTFEALKSGAAWRVIEDFHAGKSVQVSVPVSKVSHTHVLRNTPRLTVSAETFDASDAKFRMMLVSPAHADGSQRTEIFEPNLDGKTEMTIGVYGNAQDGYQFKIDDWK